MEPITDPQVLLVTGNPLSLSARLYMGLRVRVVYLPQRIVKGQTSTHTHTRPALRILPAIG